MKLSEILKTLSDSRNFSAEHYVYDKVNQINDFFKQNNLDSWIIGLSGGIDSTLVLNLLCQAAIKEDIIKRIHVLLLPIENITSNQKTATEFGMKALKDALYNTKINYPAEKVTHSIINLTDVTSTIIRKSTKNFTETAWSSGQLASIMRTPVLYYHASLLQAQNYKSIVVGTINKDEGSYIGFYGKASDAMVDMVFIEDIHKSEVYSVAKYLKINKDIISRTPTGDCWDNRTDEEMFGSPYWFLEAYTRLKKEFNSSINSGTLLLCEDDVYGTTEEQRMEFARNIEKAHKINEHKYQVGRPYHKLVLPYL